MVTSLFANQRESNLASTVALVEQALAQVGHEPAASRVTEAGSVQAWRIVVGAAITRVAVTRRSAFPHLAGGVDDIAFLMAMASKTNVHGPASYMMNTGFLLPGSLPARS